MNTIQHKTYGPNISPEAQAERANLRAAQPIELNRLTATKGALALREVSEHLKTLHASLPDGEGAKGQNTAMRHKVEAMVRELEKALAI